jgi:hypothetical protein
MPDTEQLQEFPDLPAAVAWMRANADVGWPGVVTFMYLVVEGPRTASALAEALGANPTAVRRDLKAMHRGGVIAPDRAEPICMWKPLCTLTGEAND